jgi:type I restriction enzyme S subunit
VSRIDDLIKELAPEGVQFVTLASVAKTMPGLSGKTKSDFSGGNARFATYKNVFANLAVQQNEPDFVQVGAEEKQNRLHHGDVIFTGSSETADEVGMSSVVMTEPTEPLYLNSFCFAVRFDDPSMILPGFSKYLFRSDAVRSQIRRTASGVTRINISKQRFVKIRVPVPPIEVQREVVRVLDNFTKLEVELEVELEAELKARRRQFAFHRDSILLGAATEGSRTPLGEIAEFKYGFTATARPEGAYRFLRITDINPAGKLSPRGAKFVAAGNGAEDYLVRTGDLLMARTGATFGKTMLVDVVDPAVYASFLIRVRVDESIMLPSYYWHFAQSDLYWSQANAMVSTGGQPQFNANVLKLVQVPVPSLEEQAKAVELLDGYDALASELSLELSSEISARRKQYAHFRERLLAFPEAAA